MDMIYMNGALEDIGVLQEYEMDMAFGLDENDFECRIQKKAHCCEAGFYLYAEGTEYGGIIDSIESNTGSGEVVYSGRTWHGMLNSKVLEPDSGEDYLTVSGEANAVIGSLLSRMGLSAMFSASSANSGLTISGYKMNRYITGYDGIVKMLKAVDGKLKLSFKGGKAVLSAEPRHDYSQDEEFDADLVSFQAKKNFNPVNHLVCLGAGTLADRLVVHLYADANGKISQTQTFTGMKEISEVYDYSAIETEEELIKEGTSKLKSYWSVANAIDIDFDADSDIYDVGDVIGAVDNITGLQTTAMVEKKIVTIKNGKIKIALTPGKAKTASTVETSGSGGGGDSGGTVEPYPVGSIYLSVNDTSPETLFGGTWERIKDMFLLTAGDTYAAGATGGEATHTITVDEMPSHGKHLRHTSTGVGSVGSGNAAGAYMDSYAISVYGSDGRGWNYSGGEYYPAGFEVGGSKPHNNMPPYLAVYAWKRTA
jgi:hypothetical protein